MVGGWWTCSITRILVDAHASTTFKGFGTFTRTFQCQDENGLELVLYPDEFPGSNEERLEEVESLRVKIKKFRYRSIRNFINEVFEDTANGILEEDAAKAIVHYIKGYRDEITWEEISTGHQLTVNGLNSMWVDIRLPAEVAGYMAFRLAKNECRILRVFEVKKFQVKRD